ncbi:MAG: UDP-N-acetyl-D-mannosamine dehydrogenase, partial [Pseudomonadota bacterium]
ESTSPVTTTEQMAGWLAEARPDLSFPQTAGEAADVNIAYCPERVLPGKVMSELIYNDRIIGGMSPTCSAKAVEVYKTFVEGECLTTSTRIAEMCKLVENASRDAAIAFANELSVICDKLDINVWETIALANRHPRVNILQPGPGVGGHCIAVDPWFIAAAAPDEAQLIRTAREVNDGKSDWVVDKVRSAIGALSMDRPLVVACFGLAFKPDIDDLRESPALRVTHTLAQDPGLQVLAIEPNVDALPQSLSGKAELVSADEAFTRADVLVLLVDHKQFKAITPDGFAGPIVDTKGIWA